MNIKIYFYSFLFMFISCTENEQKKSGSKVYSVSFVKEQYFGESVEFGRMGLIEVDNYKRVYITENSLGRRTIYVFASDGRYLTNIGREGNGPGEFRTLKSIDARFDKMYAYDSFKKTMFVFSNELDSNTYQLSNELRFTDDGSSGTKTINGTTVENIFHLKNGYMIVGFEDPKIPNSTEREIHYYILDSDGILVGDKKFTQKALTIFHYQVGSASITMELPFSSRSLIDATDTGLVFKAWTDEFKVDVVNTEGELVRTISHPFANKVLNRAEVISWYVAHGNFYKAIQEAPFPETWPALNDLLVDDENRLWVSTIVEDFNIYEWWVLEESGELITTFEWPRNEPIEVIKNGKMYTRQTDQETGLQQVVRYRIEMF